MEEYYIQQGAGVAEKEQTQQTRKQRKGSCMFVTSVFQGRRKRNENTLP